MCLMSETGGGFCALVSAPVLSPRTLRRLGGRAKDASTAAPPVASNWRAVTSMVMQRPPHAETAKGEQRRPDPPQLELNRSCERPLGSYPHKAVTQPRSSE